MRAADSIGSSHADAARFSDRHHPTPVYAHRSEKARCATDRSANVDLSGWPAHLAQWLIVFGALGLLIGGAKWWAARQAAGSSATEISRQSPGATVVRPPTETAGSRAEPTARPSAAR